MASVKGKRFMAVVRDVWFANGKQLINLWDDLPQCDKDSLMRASGGHELAPNTYEREADCLYMTNRKEQVKW